MTKDHTKVRVGKRNAAVLAGEDDLSEWTDEELIRGQRRDKNGKWGGRRPKVVPYAYTYELNSRRISKAKDIIADSVVRAAEVLREVMDDPNSENRDKLKAAEMVLKQVSGRADMVIQVAPQDDAPWLDVLRENVVEVVSGEGQTYEQRHVIEASVVEDG